MIQNAIIDMLQDMEKNSPAIFSDTMDLVAKEFGDSLKLGDQ